MAFTVDDETGRVPECLVVVDDQEIHRIGN
jgi:hypothetical protein